MKEWWSRFENFRRDVLGLNRRNVGYVFRYNDRRSFHLVDDKHATKARLEQYGVPVPETYGVLRVHWDLRKLRRIVSQRDEFVVKPLRGSGGGGILVVTGRDRHCHRKAGGEPVTIGMLENHVADILAGAHSRNQRQDGALFEARVHGNRDLARMSYRGVPDVRVVAFQGIPVMAMLRLPTRASDGKANLHLGGLGVGISLTTGVTIHGHSRKGPVERHPDLDVPIVGVPVPEWEAVLSVAAAAGKAIGLGYVGVDIVLDEDRGPLVLECNGRPGLAIQLANLRGLRRVLRAVETAGPLPEALADRVELGKSLWASA